MSSEFIGSFGEDSARLSYSSRLSSQRFDSALFDSFMEGGFEEVLPPPAEVASGGELAGFGPIPPHPAEEGFVLREWRRLVRYVQA